MSDDDQRIEPQNGADSLDLEGPAPLPSRRRWRRLIVAGIGLLLLVASAVGYYYVFNNVAMHSPRWVSERIDAAVRRGLDYLYIRGTFGEDLAANGESPPHHLFLEQVLARIDHPKLRRQMERGRAVNERRHTMWRAFAGLPEWGPRTFSVAERREIKEWMRAPGTLNAGWLLHALYPTWAELPEEQYRRLFIEPKSLDYSYAYTHALLTYLWLRKAHPTIANERDVDRLIQVVNDKIRRAQTWDAFTSDIYNERVAFWLYMEDGPQVRQRWIERILLSQNTDGGWTFERDTARLLMQLLGIDDNRDVSSTHATFLALYALTKYKEAMDVPRTAIGPGQNEARTSRD